VPFFLDGGTALGLERGDVLFPLIDPPPTWVTLAIPSFGVSTKEAYGWFDRAGGAAEASRRSLQSLRRRPRPAWLRGLPASEWRNDLEQPVARRHPEIARLSAGLRTHGALHAAMSGSGSAVFGLFLSRATAEAAARAMALRGRRTLVTQTLNRRRFEALSRPTG
jgi:4-diphosphocytidyl-2-C-methyl-D-erythritol kinase